MIKSGPGFVRWAKPYRNRFGSLRGLKLALQLRQDYKLQAGELFEVQWPPLHHPLYLRAGTTDLDVLDQLFMQDELAADYGIEPRLIIDAGANVGLASVYFATRFPGARIVALEVDQANYEVLQRNVAAYPQVTALHRGLWWRRAPLRIANPQARASAFAVLECGHAETPTVEGIGIAELLEEIGTPRVDLLKIDIEGGEIEVFSHGTEWLQRVGVVVIELHDRLRPGCTEALTQAVGHERFNWSEHGEYTVLTRPHP